jgi:hypothetical protein
VPLTTEAKAESAASDDAAERDPAIPPALGRVGNHAGLSGEAAPDDEEPRSTVVVHASPPTE